MNSSRHDTLLASVLDAIGNTPLIELSRVARGLHGRIVAKLEYLNPDSQRRIALLPGDSEPGGRCALLAGDRH